MKPYQMGQLIALPLQSAIRAQSLALQETISSIEQLAFEDGSARTFRFTAERMIEERKVDPETGVAETQFKVQPIEVSIPLLALMQPPSVHLQEMNVEFGVEVVEPRTEPIQSTAIPRAALGSSLAPSLALFTSLGQSNPTTMKVSMRIVREIPEGTARVIDTLADMISGVPRKTEPATRPPVSGINIEKVAGIGLERAELFRAKEIRTTAEFLKATETTESRKELSATLGVSPRTISNWRTKARLLEEGKE